MSGCCALSDSFPSVYLCSGGLAGFRLCVAQLTTARNDMAFASLPRLGANNPYGDLFFYCAPLTPKRRK